METLFAGHPISYWLELQRRFDMEEPLSSPRLIQEIAKLRGKVDFYESRIKEMYQITGR